MVILQTLSNSKIDGHFADFEQVKNWWEVFPLILILDEEIRKKFFYNNLHILWMIHVLA